MIKDKGLSEALAVFFNHPVPFSDNELASCTGPLKIKHARDLSEIKFLTNLNHLEIFASDIENLDFISDLKKLEVLKIYCCPVRNIDSVGNLSLLHTFDLSFTFVEDLKPLLQMKNLEHGVMLGNPWKKESFKKLKQSLLDRKFLKPALLFSPEKDLHYTLELHNKKLDLCYYHLDEYRQAIVSPGIPKYTDYECDFINANECGIGMVLYWLGKDDSLSVQGLFNKVFKNKITDKRVFDFSNHITMGYNNEAKDWIKSSALSEKDKSMINKFVERFSGSLFYKEDSLILENIEKANNVKIPEWLVHSQAVLTLVHPNENVWFKFDENINDLFQSEQIYRLLRMEHGERQLFIESGESFIPFVIAENGDGAFLAVNALDPADHHIYQYDSEFLGDTSFYDSLTDSLNPVFTSYADLLSHIVEIEIRNLNF